MENQHQEQSCEKIEVFEKNINLRYDLFQGKKKNSELIQFFKKKKREEKFTTSL
jgi:hypothetical protein